MSKFTTVKMKTTGTVVAAFLDPLEAERWAARQYGPDDVVIEAEKSSEDPGALRLRLQCIAQLRRMHNIVAVRDLSLADLSKDELASLSFVLQGIEAKLSHAERKSRQPWMR